MASDGVGWNRDSGWRVAMLFQRCGRHPALGAGEETAHLIIRRLPEIVVPETDGVKRFRSLGADHLVDEFAHFFAGRARGDRHRADDPGGISFAQGERAGPQRRSGGQPVVDEDHRLTGDIGGRLGASVEALAAGKLAPLVGFDRVDDFSRNAELADRILVQDPQSARGDRAHGQLFVAGDAELADEEGIKGCVEGRGDLGGDRNAATRKPEHDDVANDLGTGVRWDASCWPASARSRNGTGIEPSGIAPRRLTMPMPAPPGDASASRREPRRFGAREGSQGESSRPQIVAAELSWPPVIRRRRRRER